MNIFLPKDEEIIKEHLEAAITASDKLLRSIDDAGAYFNIETATNTESVKQLIEIAVLASKNPGLQSVVIDDHAWLNNKSDIMELIETGSKLSELHKKYDALFIPEAWEQNVLDIRQNLIVHGKKWHKFLIGDYKKSVRQLAALLNSPMPNELDSKLELVNALMEGKRLSATFTAFEGLSSRLFGNYWQKTKTNWNQLQAIATYLQIVQQRIQEGSLPAAFKNFIAKNELPGASAEHAVKLKAALDAQNNAVNELLQKLKYAKELFNDLDLQQQHLLLKQWNSNLNEIHEVVSWNVLKENIESQGAGYLITTAVSWPDAPRLLKTALQKNWYDFLIEKAMLNSNDLRKFERSGHEEIISKFRKLDVLNQYYNRAKVAFKHWEGVPKQEGGGQINILRNEFNRKARHMPIRKLMQEAGLAIQAIKPVIMMSPMSIANFLPPDSIDFDIVIFDEASQVRPVDALGAVLRGRQLVVVGDTKQMPPTSFFDKLNTETDDDENVTADMQSILGMCDAQGAPQRMLRWHYRSRHESLISLSNQEFYENKLIIFPSPGSKSRMGLAFNHLPDTFYDKGKTRTNPKEAEKVADAVMEHALQFPRLSLGVVAFSTSQMQAIQNAIEIRRRKNPEVESYFRSHPNEPFFVKNLENVQGDERDVIFISIGYGRTEDGKVPMSFGPLNNEGGERRLNVLITRAKSRCEVFTNITAADMNPGPNAKFGIRALKSFLYFAQHGKFESDQEEVIFKPQPFEQIVADSLRKEGYVIRERVGTAGFYIDLAIVDTDNPGRYLLGISCDGKSYQTAKSARDRDRLRKEVLEGMGWSLYNVWSTDWFRNPEKELRSLKEAIEKAKTQTEHEDVLEEEFLEEQRKLIREVAAVELEALNFYTTAILPSEVALQELHMHASGKVAQWIAAVVQKESPVHFEEMARRVSDANGISKIGSRVRASIESATAFAVSASMIKRKGDFLWTAEDTTVSVRDRSVLPSGSRKLIFIAPEEIYVALIKIVEESIAIQPDNAVPLIAKVFGYVRVTEDMKSHLLKVIEDAVKKEVVMKDGNFLKIN